MSEIFFIYKRAWEAELKWKPPWVLISKFSLSFFSPLFPKPFWFLCPPALCVCDGKCTFLDIGSVPPASVHQNISGSAELCVYSANSSERCDKIPASGIALRGEKMVDGFVFLIPPYCRHDWSSPVKWLSFLFWKLLASSQILSKDLLIVGWSLCLFHNTESSILAESAWRENWMATEIIRWHLELDVRCPWW